MEETPTAAQLTAYRNCRGQGKMGELSVVSQAENKSPPVLNSHKSFRRAREGRLHEISSEVSKAAENLSCKLGA